MTVETYTTNRVRKNVSSLQKLFSMIYSKKCWYSNLCLTLWRRARKRSLHHSKYIHLPESNNDNIKNIIWNQTIKKKFTNLPLSFCCRNLCSYLNLTRIKSNKVYYLCHCSIALGDIRSAAVRKWCN